MIYTWNRKIQDREFHALANESFSFSQLVSNNIHI